MPSSPSGSSTAPRWLVATALLVVYLVWGSTYLGIRVVVETMPPLLAASARFLAAGALMAAVLGFRSGPGRFRVSRAELLGAGLVGLALLTFGNGFVSLGERDVPSALAALVIGVVPLIVLVLRAVTGERIRRVALGGVALGLVGLGVLVVPRGIEGSVPFSGTALLLIASVSWSVGSFASRRLSLPGDPLVSTTLQLVLGGCGLLVLGLVSGELGMLRFERFSTGSVVALVYLVLAGSVVAYTAYTWLLQNAPISTVATYAYVNPVVAVVLGWLILSEEVDLAMIAGAAMIVAAVAFIVSVENEPDAGAGPAGPHAGRRAANDGA